MTMHAKHVSHHHHAKHGHVEIHHHKKGGGVKRAGGGRTLMKASGNPDVFKEAEGKEDYDKGDERKKGGRAKHRRTGGAVQMTGGAVRPRLDRPGRKSGGRVGSDTSPLTSAHNSASAESLPKENGGD
jgi:hypothetical protein